MIMTTEEATETAMAMALLLPLHQVRRPQGMLLQVALVAT